MTEIFEPIGSIKNLSPANDLFASWLEPQTWRRGIPIPSCKDVDKLLVGRLPSMLSGISNFSTIGYVIPCRELIESVRTVLADHPTGKILEIGAGNGYLSALFQCAGIETTATDIYADETRHTPIVKMSALEAMLAFPQHAVLMSWPEASDNPAGTSEVGREVLSNLSPGNTLFYIHDNHRSMEPRLLDALDHACEQIGSSVVLPRTELGRNSLRIYRKLAWN